jgi:potassium/hydrogen antiporter
MEITIIIVLCLLILTAYLFDITASRTRIPSVILLFGLGVICRQIVETFFENIPDLSSILPVFGTVGLILIVLEGTLELDIDRNKLPLIKKSFALAFISMMISIIIISLVCHWVYAIDFNLLLIYSVPFAVISSAIAIPTTQVFHKGDREFVIYESSFSDILGVMFFNFFVLNATINFLSVTGFLMQVLISIPIAFLATALLSFLINHIKHRIKFIPVITLIILVYAMAKKIHLPALLLILVLGLFLANFQKINFSRLKTFLHPESMASEVRKFTEITTELSFLVRTMFFLLFGFIIEPAQIINTQTLLFSSCITLLIFILRAVLLIFSRAKLFPLLFVAPRGLITILLFISIPQSEIITPFNYSVVVQVILLTVLIMMTGTIFINQKKS